VRPVKIWQLDGDERVIEIGLAPGERVIVDGVQKASPGATVKPVVAK
jgi:membrane fusion protein (multidrug efflux system)